MALTGVSQTNVNEGLTKILNSNKKHLQFDKMNYARNGRQLNTIMILK